MTWEGKMVEKTIGFAFVPLGWITGPLLAPPLPLPLRPLLLLLLLLLPLLLLPLLPLPLLPLPLLRLLLLRRLLPPPRPLRPIGFSVGERIWEIGFEWLTTNRSTATSTTILPAPGLVRSATTTTKSTNTGTNMVLTGR